MKWDQLKCRISDTTIRSSGKPSAIWIMGKPGTQCKRCTVDCPYRAITEDEQRYPALTESRRRRCTSFMSACPVRVASFKTYSVCTSCYDCIVRRPR